MIYGFYTHGLYGLFLCSTNHPYAGVPIYKNMIKSYDDYLFRIKPNRDITLVNFGCKETWLMNSKIDDYEFNRLYVIKE